MDLKRVQIFENTTWSSHDELTLLSALEEFGYGNWTNIAKRLENRKTPLECEQHYNEFYIRNPRIDQLKEIVQTRPLLPHILTPYYFRLKIGEPPRFLSNSIHSSYLAGYNAMRSEFEHLYDTDADSLTTMLSDNIRLVDDEDANFNPKSTIDNKLLKRITCSVFTAYNHRLKERHRRFEVIRKHGLILNRKQNTNIYADNKSIPQHLLDKFKAFAQFMSGEDFDYIMTSLNLQVELRKKLYRLSELRTKGIRTFFGARFYYKCSERHREMISDVQSYINRPELCVTKYQSLVTAPTHDDVPTTSKRSLGLPLQIIGLPGYERLTPDEKTLCSNVRLVPDAYLGYKYILINECKKNGSLRLQDARKAIRIDVNKTRKLYDFLLGQGLINKPSY